MPIVEELNTNNLKKELRKRNLDFKGAKTVLKNHRLKNALTNKETNLDSKSDKRHMYVTEPVTDEEGDFDYNARGICKARSGCHSRVDMQKVSYRDDEDDNLSFEITLPARSGKKLADEDEMCIAASLIDWNVFTDKPYAIHQRYLYGHSTTCKLCRKIELVLSSDEIKRGQRRLPMTRRIATTKTWRYLD
ncbi:hypothetical protein HELRODRAFT_172882 [Helobdella robusta]|uniref:SAP domain-containing protein n=1 Tax=Helobdella robusta TaxID=6412 RepID=T1F624_HELRO|nr:hypothetical protein HELRODRAFT_172882 [Helobdella robusta]ESO03859.1 hypothetical protein HELRODRAFT_172882 [Helobdella robusta]